jgi:hypothetical protein
MKSDYITTGARRTGKTAARGTVVIAFTGKPGGGKDSAATVLLNHAGFVTVAFADALRREISAAWRIDERMLLERTTKELSVPALAVGMCADQAFVARCAMANISLTEPRSARWVMQQWATFQRLYRPWHYAQIVTRWILRHAALGFKRIAVTDLREPIEEGALRELGVQLDVVRVHSARATELAEDTAGHSSERYKLRADHDVVNDGTLEALRDAVLELPPVRRLVQGAGAEVRA